MAEKKGKDKDITKNGALEEALKEIKKAYGDGAIMKLGERSKVDMDVIPSGSLAIDKALGIGGYPKGRIIELFKPNAFSPKVRCKIKSATSLPKVIIRYLQKYIQKDPSP